MELKKFTALCLSVAMMTTAMAGCSSGAKNVQEGNSTETTETQNRPSKPAGKIRIDFEGTVVAVDDSRLTLDNDKTIIVTEDTVFSYAGQVDGKGETDRTGVFAGDFVQGSTSDDPDASEIHADNLFVIPKE